MFEEGDIINGKWQVQSNHCGLPWPVDVDGNQYCGCICVNGSNKLRDAISGSEVEDVEERKNNPKFNYKNKCKIEKGEAMNYLEYDLKRKVADAIWLLNSIDLAVMSAENIEEATFKKVRHRSDDEMVKIFISGRDINHIRKFIEDSEKLLKQIEKGNMK